MESDGAYTTVVRSELIGLQLSRTRQLLKMLFEIGKIEVVGTNRNRQYKKVRYDLKGECEWISKLLLQRINFIGCI